MHINKGNAYFDDESYRCHWEVILQTKISISFINMHVLFGFFVKKMFYCLFFIVYKEFFVTLQTVHYKEFLHLF